MRLKEKLQTVNTLMESMVSTIWPRATFIVGTLIQTLKHLKKRIILLATIIITKLNVAYFKS